MPAKAWIGWGWSWELETQCRCLMWSGSQGLRSSLLLSLGWADGKLESGAWGGNWILALEKWYADILMSIFTTNQSPPQAEMHYLINNNYRFLKDKCKILSYSLMKRGRFSSWTPQFRLRIMHLTGMFILIRWRHKMKELSRDVGTRWQEV